jgi:hypothetical protein
MALAFRVNKPHDLAVIFAAHDEFISILSDARESFPREEMAEVYTAPFAFMHGRFKSYDDDGGWMIFTPMVPWTHQVHGLAMKELKRRGYTNMTILKSAEQCQDQLKHSDETISTFTTHGGYPRTEDIGVELDERAVRKTCATMGWNVPKDWEERRFEYTNHRDIHAIGVVDFIAGCNKENDADSQQIFGDNQMNCREGMTHSI